MLLGDGHHEGTAWRRTRVIRSTTRLGWTMVAVVSSLAVVLTLSGPAADSVLRASTALEPAATTTDTGMPIKVVQANINKDMGRKKFLADVETVMAEQPDIITYNEVHGRADADLLRPGYAMYRTPGPRTGWAPVAWDATVWTKIDQGTVQISKRPQGASGMVGVRFANWVTLMNSQQQVVSVISTHIAPNSGKTAQLLLPSLRALKRLTAQLSGAGPVILGGDFNMGYRSARYQPKPLAKVGLQSNFDLLGTIFSTHRKGGIIDYIFLGPASALSIESHRPVALKSDHSAVVADLRLAPQVPQSALPSFAPTKMVVPGGAGSKKERRAIRKKQIRAIRATQPGEAIHLATANLKGKQAHKVLKDAHQRGVKLTLLVGSPKMTKRSKQLRRLLGTNVHKQSWFRRDRKAWKNISGRTVGGVAVKPLRPTVLLISRAGATPAFTLHSNRPLTKASLKKNYRKNVRARVRVTLKKYDAFYRQYLAQVGRSF